MDSQFHVTSPPVSQQQRDQTAAELNQVDALAAAWGEEGEQNHASFIHSISSMSDFVVRSTGEKKKSIFFFFSFLSFFNFSPFAIDSTDGNYSHVDAPVFF